MLDSKTQEKPKQTQLTLKEAVKIGATDSVFFSRTFFPNSIRQATPEFHHRIWEKLDNDSRFVNLEIFRGAGKTTLLRTYIGKRIGYGLSKTILIIGKSQGHAAQYLRWLRRNIEPRLTPRGEERPLFAQAFDLRKGGKWDDERIQIHHGITGESIWVVAYGITGSVRGLNFDDWRPDLIVVDDVVDEENASSVEQRTKIKNLIFGAVIPGLAPTSEAPFAKLCILQTPQDFDDISQLAKRDPQFDSARFGCWTPETEDLPLDYKESIWPERWSSEVRRADYRAYLARNDLYIFAREYECRLITPETATFRATEWLRYFGEEERYPEPPHHEMWIEMCLDPVPPPTEKQIAKGLHKKDFECFSVVGKWKGAYYALESSAMRGHDPSWTVNEFFRLYLQYRPKWLHVESTAYQATIAWLLGQAMKHKGIYCPIHAYDDKKKKMQIIEDTLKEPMSHGQLYLRRDQTALVGQISHYPSVANDDEIEALARNIYNMRNRAIDEAIAGEDEDDIPVLEYVRGAP